MTDYKWIVFDLGGVLAEYVGAQRLLQWLPGGATQEEIHRCWLYSPAVRAFETGSVSPVIFAADVIDELGLKVHPDEFLRAFPDFVTGYCRGADELLASLSPRYALGLLSNTNSLQWEKLCATSNIASLFRQLFLSFKTGYMKPDRDAYLNVISHAGCEPAQILFFDDSADNVRGAINTGIEGVLVRDFEDTKRIIGEMGLMV